MIMRPKILENTDFNCGNNVPDVCRRQSQLDNDNK